MTGGIPIYKTKYNSPSEVPDKYVRNYSERDPDNKIYQSRKWYDVKKRQIFYQQRDGIPNHLRTPRMRFLYYGAWVTNVGVAIFGLYRLKQYADGKLTK